MFNVRKVIKVILICFLILFFFIIGLLIGQRLNYKETVVILEPKKERISKISQNENIVFLGDSITEIYPIEEMYGELPIVKSGVSGYTSKDILKNMDKMVYQYNTTKVFLLIGTNDYIKKCDTSEMKILLRNIKNIIKELKSNRSRTKIYIQSIYPTNKRIDKNVVANRKNNIIIETNKHLEKFCKKNGITYIDTYNDLIDKDGNFDKKYTYDGLHPNTMGYGRITKILLPYIYDNYEL